MQAITYGLNEILQLDPISYNFKAQGAMVIHNDSSGIPPSVTIPNPPEVLMGFSAQDCNLL